MSKKITLVDGHPDPAPERLIRALVSSYEDGAWSAGHEARTIRVCDTDFPLLRSAAEFGEEEPARDIVAAQDAIRWADHIVIVYPLWLGTMPALLKGFLEQVFRPGFGFEADGEGWPTTQLSGRSARIVVTMGMPEMVYRWYYRAHSLKSLERNILRFCGISPVRDTVFGMVEKVSQETRLGWLEKLHELGRQAE